MSRQGNVRRKRLSNPECDFRESARQQTPANVTSAVMSPASQPSVRIEAEPVPEPGTVEAQVRYVIPTGTKPITYEYDPPPGVPRRSAAFRDHRILIRDARRLAAPASLDSQGFTLRRHVSRVRDFYDPAEVEAVYNPEIELLLREATGARSILIFDHTVRGDADSNRNGTRIHEPVHRVHNDYTPDSGLRRVHDLLPRKTADRLLRSRVLEINVWRPIRGPLRTMPLAVCDAASLRPEDFVACDLLYPDRKGEIYYVAHRDGHRWYYYPDMQRDEALLLKCFDSDPARGNGAHAAFEHPHTPAGAPPRESIETRAFAFFAA